MYTMTTCQKALEDLATVLDILTRCLSEADQDRSDFEEIHTPSDDVISVSSNEQVPL
nr:ORF3 protein [Fusarium graminearum sclerotimonavirus 1]